MTFLHWCQKYYYPHRPWCFDEKHRIVFLSSHYVKDPWALNLLDNLEDYQVTYQGDIYIRLVRKEMP